MNISAYESHRVRRQADEQFAAPAINRRAGPPPPIPQLSYAEDLPVSASNSYAAPKGRVGPVYTFVKTDPEVFIDLFISFILYKLDLVNKSDLKGLQSRIECTFFEILFSSA